MQRLGADGYEDEWMINGCHGVGPNGSGKSGGLKDEPAGSEEAFHFLLQAGQGDHVGGSEKIHQMAKRRFPGNRYSHWCLWLVLTTSKGQAI